MSLICLIFTKGSFKYIGVQAQATLWPYFHTKAVPSNNPALVNVTLKVPAVLPQLDGKPAVPSDQCADISELVSDPEATEFNRKTSD